MISIPFTTPVYRWPVPQADELTTALFNQLLGSGSPDSQAAINAVNDFTRTRMREDGFFRRILPPLPISNDELDRSIMTDLPVRVVDAVP